LKRSYLTDFELMLLLAILRLGDGAYGAPIAREIETLGERPVMLGAVYTGLERLEANGLVSSTIGEPTPARGGRAKKYFRVTSAGARAVKQTRRALTNLWAGVLEPGGGRS
jgi:DNA-binding PadR family transcriptional regulator